jgi:hypothetical protein
VVSDSVQGAIRQPPRNSVVSTVATLDKKPGSLKKDEKMKGRNNTRQTRKTKEVLTRMTGDNHWRRVVKNKAYKEAMENYIENNSKTP